MTEEDRRRARERRQEECIFAFIKNLLEKRRQEAAPARIGRKKKKRGVEASTKLPQSNSFSDITLQLILCQSVG